MARSTSLTLTGPHQLHPHRPVDRTRQAVARSVPAEPTTPWTRRARHRPQPDEPAGRLPLTLGGTDHRTPRHPADLVLVGIHPATPTGPEAIGLLLAMYPAAAVIIVGCITDIGLLATGYARGARGLALGPRLTPPAVAALKPAWQPPPNPARPTTLSPMTGGCTFGNPSNPPVLPRTISHRCSPGAGPAIPVVKIRPVQAYHRCSLDQPRSAQAPGLGGHTRGTRPSLLCRQQRTCPSTPGPRTEDAFRKLQR